VPYFVVRGRAMPYDGMNPTLLHGYGGYGQAQLPGYRPPNLLWVRRGGVFVLANLRGGGEFGPAWHNAGRRENKQNVFDDFIAVAEDLVRRKITSPRRLGISGVSNGGTLIGAVLNQRPELFGAAHAGNPVLDMKRLARMGGNATPGELGDPDNPAHWAYMSKYSPYHNISSSVKYPPLLITANRRDDRVPVGHPRKMVARMEAMGHEVLYHEAASGGHEREMPEQSLAAGALVLTFFLDRLHPAYGAEAGPR
jgi:prolyl oligopeptidase